MRALAALGACLLLALPARADWQPTRTVKIVVPFAPGGQPDVVARTLAEPLAKALGQAVIVENRPGAGGNIAADFVAKSAPDGHTLLMGTNGPLALSTVVYASIPYQPLRDFAPVTLVGTSPNLIAVHPALGVATLEELVARAKAEPGRLNFSSVGKGSVSQLSMEMLNSLAGIRTEHIPYNGGAPAVMALVAGDVQILSLNPTALLPQMQAGKVRVLAQTGAARSALIADVPTVAESGYPGFEAGVWMAIVVPAKTPREAIARLNAEFVRAIRDPALKASLWDRQWIEPVGSAPEEVTRVMRREIDKWARVARAANLKSE
ncbi:MAG: tripartite tricarboxylate transporter substrate binding protein [Betaproteobacteria bacterium]|jgi:tripartite-type tricarboxylate transporter receptor subunit TctC|nr:tripartite tricarboxylate transporter substrate binding protein [Betaproteobacteria bacterium]